MMNRLISLIVLNCAMLSGCGVLPTPELSAIPSVPSELPRYSAGKLDIHGCPDISGRYSDTPIVMSVNSEGAVQRRQMGGRFNYVSLFYLGRRMDANSSQEKISEVVPDKNRYIEIKVGNDEIELSSTKPNAPVLITDKLSLNRGDFKCENGHVVIAEMQGKGGADGSWYNFRIHREVAKTVNGDLLFYEQVKTLNKTEHNYYLYRASQ